MRKLVVGSWLLAGVLILVVCLRQQNRPSPPANGAAPEFAGGPQQEATPTRNRSLQPRAALQPPATSFTEDGEALSQQPVEVRVKFAMDLEAKPAADLLDMWVEQAKAKNDALKLDFIADALATRLRDTQNDASATLLRMQEFFLDVNNDEYARWHIAQILGQAATRDTVAALLSLLASTKQGATRAWLLDQVAKASQNNWSGFFHEDFTDPLATAWKAASSQSDALSSLGFALASVGSPGALELLFSHIQSGGQTISEFEQKADEKAWIAFASLKDVRNPAALPVLNAKLGAGASDAITTSAAGYCLAKMGDPRATAMLLQFVQANTSDLSGYVATWFSQMCDEASVKLLNSTLKEAAFANPQNLESLAGVLATWLSQRSENLRPVPDR